MSIKKINTVKVKLTISILLLSLVIVSFVGIYYPGRFKHEQLKALEDKAKTTSSIIASNISSSIYFNDKDVLKEDLMRLLKHSDIGFIVVKAQSQNLFEFNIEAAEKNHFEDSSNINKIDDDSYFNTIERVIIGKEEVGTLYIGYKLSELHQQLSEIKKNLLVINILILFFGIVSSFTIGHLFTKPIHQLVVTAEMVKAGNFSARASINRKDEIGYLASRFNNMIETISEFYSNMENKVAQRTKELAETNSRLEHEIVERTNAELTIKHSLEEKEILLKEIHHRVKNNLQIISSLLFLQSQNIKDKESMSAFRDSQMRVRSIALVHEKLYLSKNLSKIDFSEYIKNLIVHIESSYQTQSRKINVILELERIFLPVDKAVPIGLLLNELLSNAFKYAFPQSEGVTVENPFVLVRLINVEGDKVTLTVSDNGVGLPEKQVIEQSETLGLKIVASLVSQIDGTLKIKDKDNTEFAVSFNKF